MQKSKKVIFTSKKNLQAKYGTQFATIDKLLKNLAASDAKKNLDTLIVYIDDAASAKKAGINVVSSITPQSSKKAADEIYKKLSPSYLVIFGAPDVIPLQMLANAVPYDPNEDNDHEVPSDLPYACDKAYNTKISTFTGPTRVVGRIPDIAGKADVKHVKKVIDNIIRFKPMKEEHFSNYFSVTALVWQKSTKQSLTNLFGNNTALKASPVATISYAAADLKPLIHFYNCHGSPIDSKFYGQKGNSFPTAMESTDLINKVSYGTIVAAECCFGAELYNPVDEGLQQLSMCNTYFEHGAVGFVGSSTIAYGPAEGNGLADLITQYFIKNVLSGASIGRAFLDARQKFLSVSSPLDPYELKTLGQFCLLGDPSLHPVAKSAVAAGDDTVENRRLTRMKKGIELTTSVETASAVETPLRKNNRKATSAAMKSILKDAGFDGKEKEFLFEVKSKHKKSASLTKGITGSDKVNFRTFVRESKVKNKKQNIFDVLVVKESGDKLLGWRVYHRK